MCFELNHAGYVTYEIVIGDGGMMRNTGAEEPHSTFSVGREVFH
jgi:hypothetical protein